MGDAIEYPFQEKLNKFAFNRKRERSSRVEVGVEAGRQTQRIASKCLSWPWHAHSLCIVKGTPRLLRESGIMCILAIRMSPVEVLYNWQTLALYSMVR
jgi:hypothetical protein